MNTLFPTQLLSPCGIALSMDAMIREASTHHQVASADAQVLATVSSSAVSGSLPNERPALGDKSAPDGYRYAARTSLDRYPF